MTASGPLRPAWRVGAVFLACAVVLLAASRIGGLAPLLVYALPAWIMLWVHAAFSVNQERYNLALALGLSVTAILGARGLLARRRAVPA